KTVDARGLVNGRGPNNAWEGWSEAEVFKGTPFQTWPSESKDQGKEKGEKIAGHYLMWNQSKQAVIGTGS
ncbi:MAG: hypothetical protein IKX07_02085, partial [Bacteroidales bacterium]|nr:hypothetical protein [Bacteroidales bacterium]